MKEGQQQNKSKKHIAVVVAFVSVLFITGIVVIANLAYKTSDGKKTSAQNVDKIEIYNQTSNTISITLSPTPDVSNEQLDTDVTLIEESLRAVDTNITTTDQSITNQSEDTL